MDGYMPYPTPQFGYIRSSTASRGKLSDNIRTDAKGGFLNPDITLSIRQEPKETLVSIEGKERGRKHVDPPPIIQLKVNADAECSHHYLQSPYLFMVANLYKEDKDEPFPGRSEKALHGTLCSSLHRLKDIDNKDGGFFIFGDISVRTTGTFRLNFSLFDYQKDEAEVVFLGSIVSQPFKVHLPKDFKGTEESTYLSRAFADQGVRLRLRKEPRAFGGQKRSYYPDQVPSNQSAAPTRSNDSFYDDEPAQSHKRFRTDTEDRKENYADNAAVTQAHFTPSYTPTTPQAGFVSTYPSQPSTYAKLPSTYGTIPPTSYATPSQSNYAYTAVHHQPAQQRHPHVQQQHTGYSQNYLSSAFDARQSALPSSYNVEHYSSSNTMGQFPSSNIHSVPVMSMPQDMPSQTLSHNLAQNLTQYPDIRAGEWDPNTAWKQGPGP